jgi:hypothetical protein
MGYRRWLFDLFGVVSFDIIVGKIKQRVHAYFLVFVGLVFLGCKNMSGWLLVNCGKRSELLIVKKFCG